MANPTFDQGWGYLEYGKRYGYTDGTLYYLGEPRITAQYTPAARNNIKQPEVPKEDPTKDFKL
jgi:hypothetical protein